jgi:hypothetical protein
MACDEERRVSTPARSGSWAKRHRVLPASGAGDPPSSGAATCPKCDSVFEAHTDKTPKCTVCARYDSLRSNAKKVRRDGHAPGLEMTLQEFAAWFSTQDRACEYCEIEEHLLVELGVKTQVGHVLQRLGLDRLDETQGYGVSNIALCCFGCNKAKSNTFTTEEMRIVGPAIRTAWEMRLQKRNLN